MQDRPTHKFADAPVHPLKLMSPAQFAALGVESVVFSREIDGKALVRLFPGTELGGENGPFILVMSADGKPILVTDSPDALEQWLEERPVFLATVH